MVVIRVHQSPLISIFAYTTLTYSAVVEGCGPGSRSLSISIFTSSIVVVISKYGSAPGGSQ